MSSLLMQGTAKRRRKSGNVSASTSPMFVMPNRAYCDSSARTLDGVRRTEAALRSMEPSLAVSLLLQNGFRVGSVKV